MSRPPPGRPLNWDHYERGRSPGRGSSGSFSSQVHFDDPSSSNPDPEWQLRHERQDGENESPAEVLRRRRSSLSMRLNSIAQVGGPNSLENFARSWTRAAGFHEIPQRTPSFIVSDEEDASFGSRRSGTLISPQETRSLLRQQLEREGTSAQAVEDDDPIEAAPARDEATHSAAGRESNIFNWSSHSASPFSSSYGGTYGSLTTRPNEAARRQAETLFREQQIEGKQLPDQEHEPLLIKVVEQKDGKRIQVIIGRSTLPQTIFNSVNVLVGVGLLSLPLGLQQAGWLIGITFLCAAALITRYTAGLLAKCLDLDPTLVTFSDIAWKAFGLKVRVAVGLLFSLELLAACVALVVLFADSLDALIPGWGIIEWKILCGIVLLPLSFLPLRYLSFTSVLGIISCFGIVLIIFIDGLIKPCAPGSLRQPANTSLLPSRWSDLPLSFGLLMSPWGGHSVFPNIYRDMRHPRKYPRAVNSTYIFTFLTDVLIAVVGYLMFGSGILDEVTSNILLLEGGYPKALSVCIVVFVAIIPITKVPLNARPIFVVLEDFLGLNMHDIPPSTSLTGLENYKRGLLRASVRTLTLFVIVLLAIVVPSFDAVMALLGSAMAFSICVILPVAFHLKLFSEKIGKWERVGNWVLIAVCAVLACVGTVWVFLPAGVRRRLDG